MKRSCRLLVVTLVLLQGFFQAAQAQWNQNTGTGPFDYATVGNWSGGVVNNWFPTNPATGINVTFSSDLTISSQLTYGWPGTVSFTNRSDSATARTLKLTGNIIKTNTAAGSVLSASNELHQMAETLSVVSRFVSGQCPGVPAHAGWGLCAMPQRAEILS